MAVYLTHGAKENVGDFLIHHRARELWEHIVPGTEVVSIRRWEPAVLPDDAQSLVL